MGATRIYGLVDPRSGVIRYVGRTVHSLTVRLQGHISQWRTSKTHRDRWIECLLKDGLRPTITCLEIVSGNGFEAEKWWIKKLKVLGVALVNSHPGGSGSVLGQKSTEERNRKSRESNLRTWTNPELRKANSERSKKQSQSPEWSSKYREIKTRDWNSLSPAEYEARCKRISDGRKGKSTWGNLTKEQRDRRLSGIRALNQDGERQSRRSRQYWESVKAGTYGR